MMTLFLHPQRFNSLTNKDEVDLLEKYYFVLIAYVHLKKSIQIFKKLPLNGRCLGHFLLISCILMKLINLFLFMF